MCSVIGAYLEGPSQEQIDTLKRVFVESGIRGLHATGYSLMQGERVTTRTEPLPSHVFVESHFAEVQPGDHLLQIIGHTRYSTSDLKYNQPIQVFDTSALAHNGVVTQESPDTWGRFGYDLTTSNDSELIYQSSHKGNEPLLEFHSATMAVCEISTSRGFRWYRNGGRPLYSVKVDNGWFICSTKDIANRAGLKGAKKCQPGVVYTPTGSTKLSEVKELVP